jgi:aspartyl-tRNA(Asn)/glutamyl-tRNA(Gln) amidotransferase subunit C
MLLDSAEVRKIAYLARLAIRDDDAEAYSRDLSSILDLVAQMNAADADHVEPMANPLEMVQRLREDEVIETDRRDELMRGAPRAEAGLYLVPKVLE